MTLKGKILLWTGVTVFVALAVFIYVKFFFVFGEGVKAGELNQIMYKGWIWKTYEGRLIQQGFNSENTRGAIQSNEFNFSVVDDAVADSLMRCSGKMVELHYRQYNGRLPWRGMQKYIVDEIISVTPVRTDQQEVPIVLPFAE